MKKLTVKNLNDFIESISLKDTQDGLRIPRTMTYPDIVYIDKDQLIDRREEFKDLFRQCLVSFSRVKTNIPRDLLYRTGERGSDGKFKSWTQNPDDVIRFMSLGLNTHLITEAKEKEVEMKGRTVKDFFVSLSDEEIQPAIVNDEPEAVQKRKTPEPDAK